MMTETSAPEPISKFSFDVEQAAKLLLMLSNAVRIEIFKILIHQETDVNTLSDAIGLSQSATSQHLSKMRDMNLVTSRKVAQQVFYTCCSQAVKQVLTLAGVSNTEESLKGASEKLKKATPNPIPTNNCSDSMRSEYADHALEAGRSICK